MTTKPSNTLYLYFGQIVMKDKRTSYSYLNCSEVRNQIDIKQSSEIFHRATLEGRSYSCKDKTVTHITAVDRASHCFTSLFRNIRKKLPYMQFTINVDYIKQTLN